MRINHAFIGILILGVTHFGFGRDAGIKPEFVSVDTNSYLNIWTNGISGIHCNQTNIGNSLAISHLYHPPISFQSYHKNEYYNDVFSNGAVENLPGKTFDVGKTLKAIAPKIKVEGNLGTFPEIANGDTTPQGTDNTLFKAQFIGATQSKSYRIRNIGNLDLTVSDVTIAGANPDDFTITVFPESPIAAGTFSILEIEFSPKASGVRNATVTIINNDSLGNPYTFAIRGTGTCLASEYTISPTNGPGGSIATITGTNFDTASRAFFNGLAMDINTINSSTMEVTIPLYSFSGNISVVNNEGCTSTVPFRIINSQMGGCEGDNALQDLIISEVTDATVGGLSYIEIYNGTGVTKNLAEYSIDIYYNGNTTRGNRVNLEDRNLANNATFTLAVGVVSAPTSSNTCPQYGGNGELANQTSTLPGINKKDNEHDMIRLTKSHGTLVVDQFGVYNDNLWMDQTQITGDRGFNFRRINNPSPVPNPNFNLDEWEIIDWAGSGPDSCGSNDYSDINEYDFSGGSPPSIVLHPNSPSSICELTTTLTVSASEGFPGGLPLAYQWFYNAPGTTEWVEIPNSDVNYTGQQSFALSIENTSTFNNFQYYVQVRENTATCNTASSAIRLRLNQTMWDGVTWLPTLPDHSKMAILNANYTTNAITGSFTACSLIVNSGHTLNITNNHFVEIFNDVIVHGNSAAEYGSILVDSNGSFVQRGDDAAAGTFKLFHTAQARVHKNTALKQNWYDYTYWGSPVVNESVESVLGMASSSRRFIFEASNYEDVDGDDVDDNGDVWQLASGRMIPGVGYAATSNKSGTFPRIDTTQFKGEFNTGNVTVPIHTNSSPTDNDWNFIGNPYASAIDFKWLFYENATIIAGTAYQWSQASPPDKNNPGNEVLNFSGNDYAIITVGSGNIAGGKDEIPSDFIASGQGFFVIGINSGGPLTFKNSMRMADKASNTQFFRNEGSTANKIWINLTSDNGVFNQILVAYVEGATDGIDGFSYDAERNLSSELGAIIYTHIPKSSKKYAIQGKDIHSISLEEHIPIGFQTSITQPTLYKLSIAQTQGSFFEANPIFIKDNILNHYHDLKNDAYTFTSSPGEFNNRFTIGFLNDILSTGEVTLNSSHLSIIEHDDGVTQVSVPPQFQINSVEIIDLLGRRLYYNKTNASTQDHDLSHLSASVYIVKVTLSNGQTISKRTVKRQ